MAIFTERLLRNEEPVINGDGRQTRDYVYVGDVVQANRTALTRGLRGRTTLEPAWRLPSRSCSTA